MGSLFFTRLFLRLPLCKMLPREQDLFSPPLHFPRRLRISRVLLLFLSHLTGLFTPVIQPLTPTSFHTHIHIYIHTQPHARVSHLLLYAPILYRISIQTNDIIVCIAIVPTLKVPYSKSFLKYFSASFCLPSSMRLLTVALTS